MGGGGAGCKIAKLQNESKEAGKRTEIYRTFIKYISSNTAVYVTNQNQYLNNQSNLYNILT